MSEKLRKKIFYILVAVAFLSVLIYAFLTPNMSDDLVYWDRDDYGTKLANSFFDLFKLEYMHYLDHSGRNVAHFILRIFLLMRTKWVFNVVSALVFMIQTLLIYANVDMKKKYDVRVYALVISFLWIFDPAISNTVFWEDGACNYLFTTTIILGFITYFRKCMSLEKKSTPGVIVTVTVLGILAGWCNENTSGGAILFILMILFLKWREKRSLSFVKPWMICGLAGSIASFMVMFLNPANFSRAEGGASKEAHTGLVGMMARFLKMILNIKNHYIVITLMFVALIIIIRSICASEEKYKEVTAYMRLMAFIALASAVVLILVPDEPQLRAYYGASIFFMIAVLNGIAVMMNMTDLTAAAENDKFEKLLQGLYTSAIVAVGIWLSLTYITQGAFVARVYREYSERYLYLAEQAKAGETDVVVPILRPQWKCKYTEMAYDSDILLGDGDIDLETGEKRDYNSNYYTYACHFRLDSITGVERVDWADYPEYSMWDLLSHTIMNK